LWCFGIDEIRSQKRNSAPIIDPAIKVELVAPRRQVGRRLNIHFTTEDEARQGNGLEHFMVRRLWMITHWDIQLNAEILDDNFVNMAVTAMKIANNQKR